MRRASGLMGRKQHTIQFWTGLYAMLGGRSRSFCGGVLWKLAMAQFDHILNWKLKVGSHTFPGKDGGTCINEAAIVAAGFDYQPVRASMRCRPVSRDRSAA